MSDPTPPERITAEQLFIASGRDYLLARKSLAYDALIAALNDDDRKADWTEKVLIALDHRFAPRTHTS